jgi:alkanesulfonate monooxygenase SsuD/methylene tetrahydromethanopterin reductase-like flavin-dependent oxidoreductase (luciferase family)
VQLGLSLPNRGVLFGAISVDEILELSEIADRTAVFDSVWVGDSLIAKPRLESVAILSAIAARTTRVRLGTACMASFVYRHPVIFAIQWASLDVLSGGRALLCACMGASGGEGMGEARNEVEVLGFHPKERVTRFEEGVTIVRRLLNETSVTHEGRHYRFDNLTLEPRPAQRPLPVWIANEPNLEKPDLADRQCRRVATLGDGWMTDGGPTPAVFAARWRLLSRHLREAGKDPGAFPTSYHMMININDNRGRAWDDGVGFLTKYYGPMREEFLRVWLAAGPAEEVAARIQAYVDAGCRLPILRFAAWDAPVQIRRFLETVYPRLTAAPSTPA